MSDVFDKNGMAQPNPRRDDGRPPATAQRRRPRSPHPRPCLTNHHHSPRVWVSPRSAPTRTGI